MGLDPSCEPPAPAGARADAARQKQEGAAGIEGRNASQGSWSHNFLNQKPWWVVVVVVVGAALPAPVHGTGRTPLISARHAPHPDAPPGTR
jgi:hypothetical protein